MLCGLTGSVLELRVWVKSSFESSGLVSCLKHVSAKARDGVRERNFGFPRRAHFVMKVILGNAHICRRMHIFQVDRIMRITLGSYYIPTIPLLRGWGGYLHIYIYRYMNPF